VSSTVQERLQVLQQARMAEARAAALAAQLAEAGSRVNAQRVTPNRVTPAATVTSAVPVSTEPEKRHRLITPTRLFLAVAALSIYAGWYFPTERYLTPEDGVGYLLGITGGSAILALLIYPARKRLRWTKFLGPVQGWFRAHMVLGVLGPIFILFHSNFSLGATNSNAALLAMIVVASSGLVGRYFYTRIHLGLYGRRATRADMQAAAEGLRQKVAGSHFMPELLARLDRAEQKMLKSRSGAIAVLLRPLFVTCRMYFELLRLRRYAVKQLRVAARASTTIAREQAHLDGALRQYVARRLQATRRVAEFESYERLFSLWHVFHLPLFFILLIAGIVHVASVHVY
jgi:hypothetical protein